MGQSITRFQEKRAISKEKVKVTITAVRRRTIKVPGTTLRAHCPICEHEVDTLTRSQASEILQLPPREISQLIAAGRVHAIATVSGSLCVCKNSLFAR